MQTPPLRLCRWVVGFVLITAVIAAGGVKPSSSPPAAPAPTNVPTAPAPGKPPRVREPAVAGLFYPKAATDLSRMIDGYLAAAPCVNGKTPILALLHLAREKGWNAKKLDYRNSGDTAGDKDSVVGYAAIAFYTPGQKTGKYSPEDRKFLMDLARRSVRDAVIGGGLPSVDANGIHPLLKEPTGCFVALTQQGQLRGCIGHLMAQAPLSHAVFDNARSAAVRDVRFRPVKPEARIFHTQPPGAPT